VLQKAQYRATGQGREGEEVGAHSSPSYHSPYLNHTLSLPYSGGGSRGVSMLGGEGEEIMVDAGERP
jgi:hypothetical protein